MAKTKRRRYNIFKRSGVWYMRLPAGPDGKRSARSLETRDKGEAERIRTNYLKDENARKIMELEKGERITLGPFRDEYLEMCEGMLLRGELAEKTLKNDRLAFKSFVECVGENVPLRHITQRTIDKYKEFYLARNGHTDRAKGGCNTYLRHLSAAFGYGAQEDVDGYGNVEKPAYINTNPFAAKKGRRGSNVKFKLPRKKKQPFHPNEIKAIRVALKKNIHKHMAAANDFRARPQERKIAQKWMRDAVLLDQAFTFLIYSGLRLKELINLKETDIRLDLGYIRVSTPGEFGNEIKDLEERDIPITFNKFRQTIEHMCAGRDPVIGKKVFPAWTHTSSLSHALRRVMNKAGVGKRPYTTRETFATFMELKGYKVSEVQRFMGHSSIETTMGYIGSLESITQGYDWDSEAWEAESFANK